MTKAAVRPTAVGLGELGMRYSAAFELISTSNRATNSAVAFWVRMLGVRT